MKNNFHPVHRCNDGKIKTVSGKEIDLNNPTIEMIDIADIACSLSKICRFGGQVTHFYSVGQHSVLVAYLMMEGEGGLYGLEALLHDASEAYLGDVVKPLKVMLGCVYKALESNFERVIAYKYDLLVSPEVEKLIKKYDMEALELEHEAFQKGNHAPLIAAQERLGIYYGHAHWNISTSYYLFCGFFKKLTKERITGKEEDGIMAFVSMRHNMEMTEGAL